MSESSSYGESSWGSNNGGESSSSRYTSPTPVSPPVEPKINLAQIKQKLKAIEIAVTKDLSSEEKVNFLNIFRQLIVDNEKEVIAFPTATFFISKFEDLKTDDLNETLKTKILTGLHLKQNEDKQNNSKLKYW